MLNDKHLCVVDDVICFRDTDGKLFLKTYDMHGRGVQVEVKYCPFCGENE